MEENTRPVTPEIPVLFGDLPAEDFPFTIKVYQEGTDQLLWEQLVEGPCALKIPGYSQLGVRSRVEIHTPDGQVAKAGD